MSTTCASPTTVESTHASGIRGRDTQTGARRGRGSRGRRRGGRLSAGVGTWVAAILAVAVIPAGAAAATTPTLYTNASPTTNAGLQIFDHANLGKSTNPTGTLTFRLYGPGDTTCQSPMFTTSVPVSGTGSDDSPRFTTPGAGTYQWIASYGGDADNNPVATPCGAAGQSVIVGKVWVGSKTTAGFDGGALHATTVISGGFAPVTGTITFTVTGPDDQFCSGTPVHTSTVPVTGAATYDSGSFTPTAPGTYTYRIRYSGDANNYGVGPSGCLDQGASVTVAADQLDQTPAFTNPTSGGVLDTTESISWSPGSSVQLYGLWIGTSTGGSDLLKVAVSASTQSYDVPPLPVGRTLYARLSTMSGGVWSTSDEITFTASDGALFANPLNNQSRVMPGPFSWTGVDRAQQYRVWIGTAARRSDLVRVTLPAGATSADLGALPVGFRLYGRVATMVDNVWSRYQDVVFTAGQGAMFRSPTPGQTGVDPGTALTWAGAAGADGYAVWVGTTPASHDLVEAQTTATSYNAPQDLPAGQTLYARIWTIVAGAWARYQDVSFTTAG